jgi:hypothetical protein
VSDLGTAHLDRRVCRKKLISQAAPTLTSVLPAAAPPDGTVQVFGSNLVVPAPI